jgi:NitT/TauT family transport system substrate-binding protein
MKWKLAIVVLVLAAAAGGGMLLLRERPTLAAPAPQNDRITVAVLPFISSAPIFIAFERGYFTAEHIDLKIASFNAAQAVAVAVASNDADFGVTAFTAALFNLAGKGALKVVAAQSREEPGYEFVAYVASNKAYAAGFRSPRDFAGKSVAISTVGSSFHYNLGMLATKYGFALDKVQMKPMQSIPNMMAALAGGQVDATILPANNAIKLRDDGSGHIIGWVSEQTPWQLGGLFSSSQHVDQERPLVERFVRAYQRGLADYAAAFLARDANGKRVFGEPAKAMMPFLEKWVEPKPTLETAEIAANYMDPQGRLLVGDVYKQVAWYKAQGLVDADVNAASFIDLGFVQGHFDVPPP